MNYKIKTIDSKDYIIRNNDDGSQTGCTEGSLDYEQFLQDVKEQGIGIVEGPEVVVRVDYKEKRREAYPPIGDQLDKIYHHGLEAWRGDIKMIKDQFPDSQVGLSTTANVPDWVQTEVDKL